MDDCQSAQTKKVHLQKAQTLDFGHVELGDRQAVVGGQGNIFRGSFPGNDNACRMGGSMAGHAFHFQGGVDQFMHLGICFVQVFQVGRNFQCMLQRHLQFHGDELGDPVYVLIRHPHHTAHVPDGSPGGHGTEGHDLGHVIPTVFFVYVVDDFLPALIAKVHVKVGHGYAFRVQEAFENQVIADRVNVGDAHTVGGQTAGAGATARSYRDATGLGIVDEVIDDEIVVGVPHLGDDPDLVVKAVPQLLGDTAGIPALQTFAAELFEILLVFHSVRCFEIRQLGLAVMEIEAALLRDAVGIFTGFRHHGEQIVHLVGAFYIELVCLEFHAVGIRDGLAGLDAQQNALHLRIFPGQVMGIVGGDQRDTGFPGKADQLGQDNIVLFQAVILQFDIVVPFSEQILVVQGCLLGALVISDQNGLGHFAG